MRVLDAFQRFELRLDGVKSSALFQITSIMHRQLSAGIGGTWAVYLVNGGWKQYIIAIIICSEDRSCHSMAVTASAGNGRLAQTTKAGDVFRWRSIYINLSKKVYSMVAVELNNPSLNFIIRVLVPLPVWRVCPVVTSPPRRRRTASYDVFFRTFTRGSHASAFQLYQVLY